MIINVNGFQLHYEERGGVDPLLLLHGAPASAAIGSSSSLAAIRTASESSLPNLPDTALNEAVARVHVSPSCCWTVRILDHREIQRVKANQPEHGRETLFHMATLQPDRVDAMVLVSATPYFPAQARAAMEQLSVDAFSNAEWAIQRQRHTHGDDQIRMLIEQMRGLKDSCDDMAFTPPLLATIAAAR